ncbi:unnamed protein product [Durusdinium trenchii]|uniref:Glycosyl transferase family 25 domain-containing protein n=1 Tax=Durusdinium trenchii TaxID=1381693 RepID=A0ABP0LUZ7_9DINO
MVKAAARRRPAAKRVARSPHVASRRRLPKAWVINLQRRKDRWSEVECCLKRIPGLEFERFEAIDGTSQRIDGSEVAEVWSTAANWKYVTRIFEGGESCGYQVQELRLSPGERGCGASHLHLWRRCAASHVPSLILEDDAQLKRTFAGALSQALAELRSCRPQVLYLGYTQAAPWRRRIGPSVREAEYLWTTVAYVLWPSGARRLLEELPVDQPVDNFMSQLMARKKLRGFATVPPLVKQSKAWNVDNDVAHSDDQAWLQNQTHQRENSPPRRWELVGLGSATLPVFSLDTELHVTVWNHAAAQATEVAAFEALLRATGCWSRGLFRRDQSIGRPKEQVFDIFGRKGAYCQKSYQWRQGWRWVEAGGSRGSRGFADGPSLHLAGPSGLDFDEVYEGPDEVHPHHHSHHVHLEESFDMDEFAVAVLSYGSTILFATLGAALAMRLFREVLRPARSRDELPDVVQMDIPGVQPFRPFAGQGYHLQADLGKPPDPPKPAEDEMTGSGVLALD